MNKLKELQIKKLLKELDYIESDFEYRNEIISEADSKFISSINSFLLNHPDLKEIYDNKVTEKINKSIQKKEESTESKESENEDTESNDKDIENKEPEDIEESDEDIKNKKPTSKIKKLYREIVKMTHPDKVKDGRLNDLYIKATKYYEDDNRIGVYAICNELNIPYELSDEDIDSIYNQIKKYEEKIRFIESTYTWKWYNTEDDSQKSQILMNYIKMRINS
jgi:hypothetical protein